MIRLTLSIANLNDTLKAKFLNELSKKSRVFERKNCCSL